MQDDEETTSKVNLLLREELRRSLQRISPRRSVGWSKRWQGVRIFLQQTELGHAILSIAIMASLLLVGVAVMMPLEGWTFIQALYFSTFVMTTVG